MFGPTDPARNDKHGDLGAVEDQSCDKFLPASEIPVHAFREILIWPLALHLRAASDDVHALRDAVTRTVDGIGADESGQWQPVDDPSEHIPPPGDDATPEWRAHRFQEGVYFHDFVQRFLFSRRNARPAHPSGKPDNVPFRLFRRTDIKSVEVTLADPDPSRPNRGPTLNLTVERVNLYLFQTGVAMLVVEVASDPTADLRLSHVQTFHDQFRRAYLPFVMAQSEPARLVVSGVTWLQSNGERKVFPVDVTKVPDLIKRYLDQSEPLDDQSGLQHRSPPVFEHWRWVLPKDLTLASDPPPRTSEDRWHHVVDERMPSIATISVTPSAGCAGEPPDDQRYFKATAPADLVRLCFADAEGGGAATLYDTTTLPAFDDKHAYSAYRRQGTLFLASGYAFVAFGAGWFFDNIIAPIHMRRHYFQIGLLAHFELASLLTFSSRISRAVTEYNPSEQRPEQFEQVMHSIEEEYLQFIHRFHFTGVSNHLQAQEITALFRRNLRLAEIFSDLHQEITSATEYLFNRAASRGASIAQVLSVIGAFGVLFGLVFSFLGMNVFSRLELETLLRLPATEAPQNTGRGLWFQIDVHAAILAFAVWIGGVFVLLLLRLQRSPHDRRSANFRRTPVPASFDRRLERWLSVLVVAAVCLAACLVWFAWR